jgi:catalase
MSPLFPNSFHGPQEDALPAATHETEKLDAAKGVKVKKYSTKDADNFTQCGHFYRNVLSAAEKTRLVDNIAGNLIQAQEFIQDRAIQNFSACDPEYGRLIRKKIQALKLQPSSSSILPRPQPAALNPPRTVPRTILKEKASL